MTFREFQQTVCTTVTELADGFTAPDDDWSPIALLVHDSDAIALVSLPSDPALQTATVIAGVEEVHARKVAIVTSAWSRPHPRAAETAEGRAAAAAVFGPEMPTESSETQVETVVVFVLDGERCEAWLAPITRDGTRPPSLGPWRPAGEPSGAGLEQVMRALR